ncbi:MAG: THUMP domain-containing protein [Methanomassiliicoccaceae archaeon]|nr:THUMP domain-containing protein [Methanomassiliicoccaceae archaeon]
MQTILARYSEIGLKSTPVRMKFENRLRDNMIAMLAADRVEALVTKRDARFYIESEDTDAAVAAVRRVFGISSLSVAEVCTSDLGEICSRAAEYSMSRLRAGESFAVKARREGSHGYTSLDAGREVGSAIFLANEDKGVRVDLSDPDVTFFLEVRNNLAFIFGSYVRCHGGLPLGSQGRVLAEVCDDRGVLSAWLMMKRGCKAIVKGERQPLLERYDPEMKYGGELSPDILGVVTGASLRDLEGMPVPGHGLPVYFPTVGMSDSEVSSMLEKIKGESAPPGRAGQ